MPKIDPFMTSNSRTRTRILLGTVVVSLLAGSAWWLARSNGDSGLKYRFAKVERGPIVASVAASGTVNAVVTVQVGSQVSGQVRELAADFNTVVKKDQVIARIDPATFELRVAQATADLASARSAVAVARANLAAQQAQFALARANVAEAKRDLERKESLIARGFLSPAERDKAGTVLTTASEQARAQEAQSAVAAAQVDSARAQVSQRQAVLKQAQVDLDRTFIRAPVDGIVISRSIDAGQTVAASLQAPTLFTIAQDLSHMQVDAAIDEADVGRLALGQTASFTVDAFPGRTFNGEVRQIRKAAQNLQNVVTYTVVIATDNPGQRLLPGMTANVRIVTDQRDSVLKLANAALRFRPPNSGGKTEPPAPSATLAGSSSAGVQAAQQFRQKVMTELALDDAQKTRMEQVFAEARPKYMALREIADEGQRRKAGERVRAQIRARIVEVLKPEQKLLYDRIVAEMGGRATSAQVWVAGPSGKPQAATVKLGLSDGSSTEIAESVLKEGDEVMIGVVEAPSKSAGGPRLF